MSDLDLKVVNSILKEVQEGAEELSGQESDDWSRLESFGVNLLKKLDLAVQTLDKLDSSGVNVSEQKAEAWFRRGVVNYETNRVRTGDSRTDYLGNAEKCFMMATASPDSKIEIMAWANLGHIRKETRKNDSGAREAFQRVVDLYNEKSVGEGLAVTAKTELLALDQKKTEAASSGGCFVATAAFESVLAPEVSFLRRFRDRHLSSFWVGRELVSIYYRVSPPIAEWISLSAGRRAFARCCLRPVIAILRFGERDTGGLRGRGEGRLDGDR